MSFSNEEESKKARIFQREKRQELQLIIERCNKIEFEYVKVPAERNVGAKVFGSCHVRKIHFFADDKFVNSYMRRCFKEHFPEPISACAAIKDVKKPNDEQRDDETEQKPSHPFSSKVPRFQEIIVDSSQGFKRKKKAVDIVPTVKTTHCAFGTSSKRTYMVTRDVKGENNVPGSAYIESSRNVIKHNIKPAYSIVCSPKMIDSKCDVCEFEPKNVYWKNERNQSVLCRKCYNEKVLEVKNKSRGIVERLRKLKILENDYKRKRHCSFFHLHNNTTAHIYMFHPKEFRKRCQKENFINTFLKY